MNLLHRVRETCPYKYFIDVCRCLNKIASLHYKADHVDKLYVRLCSSRSFTTMRPGTKAFIDAYM